VCIGVGCWSDATAKTTQHYNKTSCNGIAGVLCMMCVCVYDAVVYQSIEIVLAMLPTLRMRLRINLKLRVEC
jgi:hypothetical protein